jgi:type IV pilus assembly protein PilF
MKANGLILSAVVCCWSLSACISTTTGSVTEPERNESDAAELNYQLGARYYQAGNYELARDRLLLATELDPKMAVAYSTLALTYEKLNNNRLATNAYETAVRVAPRDFDVQNAYAVFLCRSADYEKAKKHFDKSIRHFENDNSEVMMTNAGMCMMQMPDVVAAEEYFRAALERQPKYGEALLQLCLLKFSQKDYLGARAFLQRLMSAGTRSAGVLYLASRIEDMLGNDRGRMDFEDQLIREFPTSPEARKVLSSS